MTAPRTPRATTRPTLAAAPEPVGTEEVKPKKVKKPKANPVREQDKPGRVLHIDFAGVHYVIQKEDVDDLEIFELIEDGKAITALRKILGLEKWALFKESARSENGRVTMDTTNEFLGAVMEAIGGSRGNS